MSKLSNAIAEAKRQGWAEWIRGPADEAAVLAGHYFDIRAALRPRRFFSNYLVHSKGEWAGKPFDLIDWQWLDVIAPLFGWKRPDGLRRYRQGFVFLPKKNGKTTLSAGIALYLTVGDDEPRAEVYAAATTRDQASIVFNEASSMARTSPRLGSILKVFESTRTIRHPASGSFFNVLPHGAESAEGKDIHGLVFDEVHAQKSRALFDCLRYGGKARRQPLQVSITTAGEKLETICGEQYLLAKKVLAGDIIHHSFFAFICEADREDDWTKPETWRKANPSLGITLKEEDFAADVQEAMASPQKENSLRRYLLNQWVGSSASWFSTGRWDDCIGPELAIEDPIKARAEAIHRLATQPCMGAMDLSATQDLTALGLLFRSLDDPQVYEYLPWFWIPEDRAMEKEQRDQVPYMAWHRQGFLSFTPGNVVDYDTIRQEIIKISKQFNLLTLAIDRWNAVQINTELQKEGINTLIYSQGFAAMSPACKELERLVLLKRVRHFNNPVLKWMASNVVLEKDSSENIRPSKKKSPDKIDGVVTLAIGVGLQLLEATKVPETKLYTELHPDQILVV